jgi:hypothetical protein
VASTFAPNQDSVDTVKEWLVASGIHPDRVNYAAGKGWLELKSDYYWDMNNSDTNTKSQCDDRRG